jgi:arylsulfatase B
MSQRWRLINGKELYEIGKDPGQKNDVAKDHPDQVAKMRAFYEEWWADIEPTFSQTTSIHLGHPDHPRVSMTSHDWIGIQGVPWNQGHIRNAYVPKKGADHDAYWAVKVLNAGKYSFELRRWPAESNKPINASLPAEPNVPGASKAFRANPGKAFDFVTAHLKIDGKKIADAKIEPDATHVRFTHELSEGSYQLSPVFKTKAGREIGGYYLIVTKMD